jgi:hypothetical protein
LEISFGWTKPFANLADSTIDHQRFSLAKPNS